MTPEHEHILQFLIKFLNKNYKNMESVVDPHTYKVLSKTQLIKCLKTDPLWIDSIFIDTLMFYKESEEDNLFFLDKITVFENDEEDYWVYEVDGKYIKHWRDDKLNDYFKFVNKVTKLVEVSTYE